MVSPGQARSASATRAWRVARSSSGLDWSEAWAPRRETRVRARRNRLSASSVRDRARRGPRSGPGGAALFQWNSRATRVLCGEGQTLSALEIGVEDEAARVVILHQHHAGGRGAVGVDGREAHGVRVFRLVRRGGIGEPACEQSERVAQLRRHPRPSAWQSDPAPRSCPDRLFPPLPCRAMWHCATTLARADNAEYGHAGRRTRPNATTTLSVRCRVEP